MPHHVQLKWYKRFFMSSITQNPSLDCLDMPCVAYGDVENHTSHPMAVGRQIKGKSKPWGQDEVVSESGEIHGWTWPERTAQPTTSRARLYQELELWSLISEERHGWEIAAHGTSVCSTLVGKLVSVDHKLFSAGQTHQAWCCHGA